MSSICPCGSRHISGLHSFFRADSRSILDLGCGTGLELDEIFKRYPDAKVFGIDLCQDMLDRLQQKHGHRNLETVCADYCQYNFGSEKWDSVISFESLHHFLPDKKRRSTVKFMMR